jgi:hypothetical protein
MKKTLMLLSIAFVFGMALFANAYAGSTESSPFYKFNSYGADYRGPWFDGPPQNSGSTEDQSSQGQKSMGMMNPFYGFNSYGADYHGAPVEGPPQNWEEGQPQEYSPCSIPGAPVPLGHC